MFKEIYLDNNATTKVDEIVLEAMLPYLKEEYGNRSSTYDFSKNVKIAVRKARESVAALINASRKELTFTSCATESNNTAIFSAIRCFLDKKHLITTKVEHTSILDTMKYLESIGYEVTYLSVDKYGRLDLNELKEAIREDTLLVSIMYANNETGNIYPIKEISKIVKEHDILFHVDAVQAIGKIKVDMEELNVDFMSLSGHKIHAPKGIGILYHKLGTPFIPLIFGHQERTARGGTENVPYIVALGKAAELIIEDDYNNAKELEILKEYLLEKIKENIQGTIVYGDPENNLPNTLNIGFDGVDGEELSIMLNSFGVYVSTGSACNSKSIDKSHVLIAMGVDMEKASPIRISLSKYNTKEEIDEFIKRLVNVITTLRKNNK